MVNLRNIEIAVIESPGWKTFFSAIIPIAVGFFSGLFVIQITTKDGIEISHFYEAWSFYVLLTIVVMVFFYYRAIYLYEKSMVHS